MPQANIVWTECCRCRYESIPYRTLSAEPMQIHIAAGWFSMGSDIGQDVESPVHRVWVDSFAMAATQVTVGEYARFLDATGTHAAALLGRCQLRSSAATSRRSFVVRRRRLLRLAFHNDRLALSATYRSRVGTGRARRCRRNGLPLGRRSADVPSWLPCSLEDRT